jgi:hypothetical protein
MKEMLNRTKAIKGEYVTDPAGWSGSELASNDDWIIKLTSSDLDDLKAMAENYRTKFGSDANSLLDKKKESFDTGVFSEKLKDISHALKEGKGLVLLRGLPMDELELIDAAIIYWAIGLHIGDPASNNPDGDMIGHVTDLGKDLSHPKHRGYQTRATLDFHTDQANIVGLLCIQTAMEGGQSKVVSSISVYNELIKRRPDLLGALTEDYYWSMMGEVDENDTPYYTSPVFNFINGYLCTSFGPSHMIKGHLLPEAPDMTAAQTETIDVVEKICEDLHYAMDLERGDIQLLNNMVVMHTRNSYVDWSEPERKRRLWRLWLTMPGIRPLTPFMEHWRTGLLLKDTMPRITLSP